MVGCSRSWSKVYFFLIIPNRQSNFCAHEQAAWEQFSGVVGQQWRYRGSDCRRKEMLSVPNAQMWLAESFPNVTFGRGRRDVVLRRAFDGSGNKPALLWCRPASLNWLVKHEQVLDYPEITWSFKHRLCILKQVVKKVGVLMWFQITRVSQPSTYPLLSWGLWLQEEQS